jgi:hypothetical protein
MTILSRGRQLLRAAKEQRFMSAKWNWLIDNSVIRSVIETSVFALWIAASVGILFAARF